MVKFTIIFFTLSFYSLLASDLYKEHKCNSCHGDNGMTKAFGEGKLISEMRKEDIVSALNEYKSGTRVGKYKVIMMGFASKLSESEIIIIADEIGI